MKEFRNIILDGNKMQSKKELHLHLKQKLEFPEFYGENLDALWDSLTELIGLHMKISLINHFVCKEALGEYCDKTVQIFRDVEKKFSIWFFI